MILLPSIWRSRPWTWGMSGMMTMATGSMVASVMIMMMRAGMVLISVMITTISTMASATSMVTWRMLFAFGSALSELTQVIRVSVNILDWRVYFWIFRFTLVFIKIDYFFNDLLLLGFCVFFIRILSFLLLYKGNSGFFLSCVDSSGRDKAGPKLVLHGKFEPVRVDI